MDEFEKDLKENAKGSSNRAEFFKLKNGDNKIVLLSNPIGYSELFNVGIAFENCGYGKWASRRYKAYVKDLSDNKIKIANFSYTTAQLIHALSKGARTKFDSFPVPYVINLQTENAGTKEVKTNALADEDYVLTEEDEKELNSFDPIQEIIDRLKSAQKKKLESDFVFKEKVDSIIQKKLQEESDKEEKRKKDKELGKNHPMETEETIQYPEDDINPEDIPF